MLKFEITDIHSANLKAKLKRIGVQKSSEKEFKTEIESFLEQVKKAPSEDDIRARIKELFVTLNVCPSKDIILEKNKVDLSLMSRNGKHISSIIEVKHPSNQEMLKINDGNRKAFRELIWYFLNEISTDGIIKNQELETLIATDGIRWFIFSAKDFYNIFGKGDFSKTYKNFKNGKYGNTTDDFYRLAQKFLDETEISVPCVYFDFSEKYSTNDIKIVQGILSQQFILGEVKEKDSNDINEGFYNELLHIIGLQEYKDDKKTIITRKINPDSGSLLELTLEKLEIKYPFDGTFLNSNLNDYGKQKDERLFNIAVELCLMWVNRILFLKLLEAQLNSYKKDNKPFLNISSIRDFQILNDLFFNVMGKSEDKRRDDLKTRFAQVPYLNSSLFECSRLESMTFVVSNLAERELPLFSKTILKNKKKAGSSLHTLEYLFEFLDAYKFGDDNDCTINASVLGKVFEKINGYKDGSVYTPGYITFAMCKDTIDAAVLSKFSKLTGKNIHSLGELQYILSSSYEKIQDYIGEFNSITLCDISVGSGHYLVSALNYLLYLKWHLGLFLDSEKRDLRRFSMVQKDDTLKIYQGAEEFRYDPRNAEYQLLQEALFEEKKRILENCLFGADINPNSVNICRLRLWIELLKSSYYKRPNLEVLQTLPNVDLNIRQGDSLLSKIPVDIKQGMSAKNGVIPKNKIDDYKELARNFKNTDDKEIKSSLEQNIKKMKEYIRGEYMPYFEFAKEDKEKNEEMFKNDAYRHSLEWMFEFPELVNDKGQFVGFDIVVGNPPYIKLESIKNTAKIYGDLKKKSKPVYETFCNSGDIYTLFVERAYSLLNDNGVFSYIMPNKWMTTDYGNGLRKFFLEHGLDRIIDFGDYQVFPKVTTYTCIVSKYGKENRNRIEIANVSKSENLGEAVFETFTEKNLSKNAWVTTSLADNELIAQLEKRCTTLKKVVGNNCYRGIQCGCVEAFLIDRSIRDRLIEEHSSAKELLKPIMKGEGQIAWNEPVVKKYLVAIPKGFSYKKYGIHDTTEMWELFRQDYPSLANWLNQSEKAKTRGEKGDFWWELRACSYYSKFSEPRIMYQRFPVRPCFIYSNQDLMCDDTMWMINVPSKSLLTILNSKLGWWAVGIRCSRIQGGRVLTWDQFKDIPIPNILPNSLAKVADEILENRRQGNNTAELEKKADMLVYKAYGLSFNDIKVVDPNTSIDEDIYNSLGI